MGATSVWERWGSVLPDGSVNPGEVTHFNHDALGAVADWMHRTVGGNAPWSPAVVGCWWLCGWVAAFLGRTPA